MKPMGKLKYELFLRMGSMGPSRLSLRVQEKVWISQSQFSVLPSSTQQIRKKCLDPRLKVLGLWSQIVWAPILAPLLMAVGCLFP